MNNAPKKPTEILAHVAKAIEDDFPEQAALLRQITIGRPVKRTAAGFTANNETLAKRHLELRARVARGASVRDVLADAQRNWKSLDGEPFSAEMINIIWTLEGRSEAKKAVKLLIRNSEK